MVDVWKISLLVCEWFRFLYVSPCHVPSSCGLEWVSTLSVFFLSVDQVSDSCDSYDLTISIKKSEVVYQPAPGKPYKEPTITVKCQRLQVVDKFTYLGSTLSRVVHIDDEVNARIAKASAAFAGYVEVFGTEVESDLTQS